MAERISFINIRTSTEADHPQRSFSMRGYVSIPSTHVNADSTLTSVTGLESPNLTVIGGEVAYGGSVFTGIIPNDREAVMTVRPRGLSVNDIKVRLNTLIAFSTIEKLILEVQTVSDKGITSRVVTTGYITSVTAPIMANDDALVITFRAPSAYLQRDSINVTNSHVLRYVNASGGRAVYKLEPGSLLDDSAATAPSPFQLDLSVQRAYADQIAYCAITDSSGNTYQTSHMNSFPGMISPVGDAILGNDSYARVSTVGDTNGGPMYVSRERLVTTVQPEWPLVYPSYSRLTVEVGFKGTIPQNASSQMVNLHNYRIYPRVFGI